MALNLFLDKCRPATFAAGWIPGRLLACIDLDAYPKLEDYLFKGLNNKARQHYNKAARMGYVITIDQYDYRNEHLQDIYEINTSMKDRQGREMDLSYHSPQEFGPAVFCDKHLFILLTCIDPSGKIVAYMEFYIVGEFSQTSRVLGHADHLHNGVMIQVFVEAFNQCKQHGVKIFCYGEWESGTEGLKFFKHSTGFKPQILSV